MTMTMLAHSLRRMRRSAAGEPVAAGLERRRWEVRGTVQGVGYRAFVHRLAADLALNGRVRNSGGVVVIDADGPAARLDLFEARLRAEAPPLAAISGLIQLAPVPGRPFAGFVIEQSAAAQQAHHGSHRDVPPDAGICDACLAELFDPADRRYRYPFISCANCGPRASIISSLPYDRHATSMDEFPMCAQCAAQYADPADRRFHAEPMACASCGPVLSWRPAGAPGGAVLGEEALQSAAASLSSGGIVALKCPGGYQLICDATNEAAVELLRARKHAPAGPVAIMVEDLSHAARYARLSAAERQLLSAPARPIVLSEPHLSHGAVPIAASVRAGSPSIGICLPSIGLQHLLLRETGRPIAVTSGNLSGEPIVIDDAEAHTRLGHVADGICAHDQRILARYDESVALVHGDAPAVIRRARGFSPAPLNLPTCSPAPLLGVGAQADHTFTLAARACATVSARIGDLADAAFYAAFRAGLDHAVRVHGVEPEFVAHDLHPAYLSTRYAVEHFPESRRMGIQHHHAHVASCAAEHGLTGDVIGLAYDGRGFGLGDDGTYWGGEVLVANLTGYTRVGRFARAPIPDGGCAGSDPERTALAYLAGLERIGGCGIDPDLVNRFAARCDSATVAALVGAGAHDGCAPLASSAGRLFDVAAALLGLSTASTREGAGTVALDAAAADARAKALPWRVVRDEHGLWVYDTARTLEALLAGSERDAAKSAAAFHHAVAEASVALVGHAARLVGAKPVCLSGGMWQSRRLTELVAQLLRAEGFDVFFNQRVPCDDGGISYGQAAIAAARLAER